MFQTKPVSYCLILTLLLTQTLHADIIPAGRKPVSVTIHLDFGDLKDLSWSVHVVKDGDSYSKIAKDLLGDASRSGELEKANPNVRAKFMRPGMKIEIPPKTSHIEQYGKKVPVNGWRFYWCSGFQKNPGTEIVGHGMKLGLVHYHGILIAIPNDKKAEYEKALKTEKKGRWKAISGLKFFNVSDGVSCRETVKSGLATKSIAKTVKIKSVARGKVHTSVSEKHLGARGKELSWGEERRLPLLAASGVGLLLFGGLIMRRRRLPELQG